MQYDIDSMPVASVVRMVQASTDKRRHYEEQNAPRFDFIQVFRPNEMDLSRAMAFLLHPKETHGQGITFLGLLLRRLAKGEPERRWQFDPNQPVLVRPEVKFEDGRVDIRIEVGAKLLIIENKPWAKDGLRQVQRTFVHLDKHREYRKDDTALIYLTTDGRSPSEESISEPDRRSRIESGHLHNWSYRDHILEWLTECQNECRAERVSTFIGELHRYISTNLAGLANMFEHDPLLQEITLSPENARSAMEVINRGEALRRRLLTMLTAQVKSRMGDQGEVQEIDHPRWPGLSIKFEPLSPYVFGMQFWPSYKQIIFGIMSNVARAHDKDLRARMVDLIGDPGEREQEWWIWWGKAGLTSLLPIESDWANNAEPWAMIVDGGVAEIVMGAANRFREVLARCEVL